MSKASDFHQQCIDVVSATILNGQSDSDTVSLNGTSIAGLYVPSAFTGTELTFQASFDGTNFFVVQDGLGTAIAVTVSPSIYVPLSPQSFYGIRNLRIISGSPEASDRVLSVVPYSI